MGKRGMNTKIFGVLGLILLIAGISANWLAWRRHKKEPPTAATEGGYVTPNFIVTHSESGKE